MTGEILLSTAVLVAVAAPPAMLLVLGALALIGRPLSENGTGYLSRGVFLVSTSGLVFALAGVLSHEPTRGIDVSLGRWFGVGHYAFQFELLADALSLSFGAFSAALCGVVAAFSHRYLHREPGFHRFFILLTLFAAGMNLVVFAGTIEVAFAGWEMVGLSSALLVAFFHDRPLPVENGLRTFVVYRMSDIGLFWAAVLCHHYLGTGSFRSVVGETWPAGGSAFPPAGAALIAGCLILAAIGKSAQLPVSGWLPRAMEGPTPSSAIFYGALSIHAGAFLLLRWSSLLEGNAWLRGFLVVLGLATAAHAALTARVQTDVKSSLAYASLTQVGIILAEIGLGFHWLPLIHMVAHAALRSVQFLRAPSVLHDLHHHGAPAHDPGAGPASGGFVSRLHRRLYRFAIDRGFLDTLLDDGVVRPVLRAFRAMNRLEQGWYDRLAGMHGRAGSAPEAPPRFKEESHG